MLYGSLWRALPGNRAAKVAQSIALALVVVVVCFLWVFPAVADHLPFNDNTVDGSIPTAPPASTSPPSTPLSSTQSPVPSGGPS